MSATVQPDMDQQEQIAHINQMITDTLQKQQQMRLAIWPTAISGIAAGGGLVAATVALMKVLGP